MYTQCPMYGEPFWRQRIDLESRREVIKVWLSSSDIPSQLVEVLQEMRWQQQSASYKCSGVGILRTMEIHRPLPEAG